MNRKNLFSTLYILALSAISATAAPIDAASAKAMARKYLNAPVSINATTTVSGSASKRAQAENPALYLFNNEHGEGFVIVSADDRVGKILGYSDKGSLDMDNIHAPLAALIARYTAAVEAVRVDSLSISPYYAKPPKAFVNPLVTATWSQEYPYNYYTPTTSSGQSTLTGCAITAAVQVLSAHKWPAMRPEGAVKGEGAMALDYYDWDNMLDDYSSGGYSDAQAQAVGVLMRDMGNFASATYGSNGTLCDEGKVWNALQNDYNCTVRQMEKDLLPGGEFLQAIYNDLSLGCPVFMSGGDHAFVYDGYDENGLVHINWGWAGLYNGYYDINTAEVPSGGYGSDGNYYEKQVALFVHPNNGIIEPLQPQPAVLTVKNDEGLQFVESEGMTTSSKIPAQLKGVGARNIAQDENGAYTGQIGIGLFTQQGECLHVFAKSGTLTWTTYYNAYNFESNWWAMDLSEIDPLADGTYLLRPLGRRLLDADTEEWGEWTHMVNGNTVPMIVDNGNVSFVQADGKPHLSLVGMPEVLAPAYQYSSQLACISVKIANLSRYQARGEAQVTLSGTGDLEGETFVVPNSYLTHFVAQRQDTTQWLLRFITSYTSTDGSFELKPGKYRMSLRFKHNIETSSGGTYDIAVPDDFLLEVFPDSYKGCVTVTAVKLLDADGEPSVTSHFDLNELPTVTLGICGYSSNWSQNSYATSIRYRLVDVETGATAYTSNAYSVSFPRNTDTNLASSTSHTVALSDLEAGTYEVHVDVERDGEWLDRWNANTFRRQITLYAPVLTDIAQPTVAAKKAPQNNAVYGIDGRRYPAQNIRGLRIVNGKKWLVKGK